MPGRRLATISLLAAGAGLLMSLPMWIPTTTEQSQRTVGDPRVSELIRQGRKGDLVDSERRELLERLLTSGRQRDAQRFLEASAEAPWSRQQRLLLIDLQRRNGDLKAASEGMKRLQRLYPSHPDVLSQQGLLTLKTASPEAALNVMEQRLKTASPDQRINLVCFADAQLRSGKRRPPWRRIRTSNRSTGHTPIDRQRTPRPGDGRSQHGDGAAGRGPTAGGAGWPTDGTHRRAGS